MTFRVSAAILKFSFAAFFMVASGPPIGGILVALLIQENNLCAIHKYVQLFRFDLMYVFLIYFFCNM